MDSQRKDQITKGGGKEVSGVSASDSRYLRSNRC